MSRTSDHNPPLVRLEQRSNADGLTILGGFHPAVGEQGVPEGCGTLLLLGPDGSRFWPIFSTAPEYRDRQRDPLDRWSLRVIGTLAEELGGVALFPFTGPPWRPFYRWALNSGRCRPSPVRLLVHDRFGLMVSFRGALALPERLRLPAPGPMPCERCPDRPCLAACPVAAFGGQGYDASACHAYLGTPTGNTCLSHGCAVRRACPAGRDTQPDAQAALHMRAFHGLR